MRKRLTVSAVEIVGRAITMWGSIKKRINDQKCTDTKIKNQSDNFCYYKAGKAILQKSSILLILNY